MVRFLSIVIPVCNEEASISAVLQSCLSLNPKEIIVVANGCTDRTIEISNSFGVPFIVVPIQEPLGNDVGRAIGAKNTTGDAVLFLDADFSITQEELTSFLTPILSGQADAVLNDFSKLFYEHKRPHSITVLRQAMNAMINRPNLGIDSILSVPHALTKEAIEAIV